MHEYIDGRFFYSGKVAIDRGWRQEYNFGVGDIQVEMPSIWKGLGWRYQCESHLHIWSSQTIFPRQNVYYEKKNNLWIRCLELQIFNGVVERRIKKARAKWGVCCVMESKENKNF